MTQQHFFIGIFLLLLLWTCTVSAQEPKTLTLEDSIQIARQTNLSIQTTQERVKSAEAQVGSVHAGLLPNVSLNSSYRYAKDLPKSVLEASGGFGPPGVGGEMPASTDTGGDDENIIELEFGAHHNFQARDNPKPTDLCVGTVLQKLSKRETQLRSGAQGIRRGLQPIDT